MLATISLGFLAENSISAGKVRFFNNGCQSDSFYCRAGDFPKQDVSTSEEKELLYMREEEKMAHDIYSLMYDKWGSRPFYNITSAEERHMAAIKTIINKYALTDPVKDTKIGVFTNAEINKLYTDLIEQGNKSI